MRFEFEKLLVFFLNIFRHKPVVEICIFNIGYVSIKILSCHYFVKEKYNHCRKVYYVRL